MNRARKPARTIRSATTLPERGHDDRSGARRALAAHGPAVPARPHQPLAAARRGRGGRRAQGWSIVDCGIDERRRRAPPGSSIFADRARRPAGAARHRHPHAPRPHRPAPHWLYRALERAPVDQRHRLQRRAGSPAAPAPASAGRSARLHGAARPGRRSGRRRTRSGARTNYYASLVPAAAGAATGGCSTAAASRSAAARRSAGPATPATATRPSTWRCTAPSAGRADQRRHGAAAHLHQRQRASTSSPRPNPLRALPRLDRAHARAARRHAGAALARPAVHGLHTRIDQLQAHHDERFAERARGAAPRRRRARRAAAGAVQAPARPAPDDLRDGRVDRPPARALVPRQARAHGSAPTACYRFALAA